MSDTYISQRILRRQREISQSWLDNKNKIQSEIDAIKNTIDRKKFSEALSKLEENYIQAMTVYNERKADKLIETLRSLRCEIISAQMEEKRLDSLRGEFLQFTSALKNKSSSYFINEIQEICSEDSTSLSIDEQIKNIRALKSKAHGVTERIKHVESISLDGLSEDIFVITPNQDKNKDKAEEVNLLLQDIFDFWERMSFYDEREADRLKPLIDETTQGTSNSRLKLIRSQIKTKYQKLREQVVMTDIFKRDLRDFLPPVKRAIGAEKLYIRIEELLTAPFISRDEYDEICSKANDILEEQNFIEKVDKVLSEMGYSLMDENGKPAHLTSDQMRMLETPYDGYRVRIKVGKDNKLVTRLIRVVGSEEEKSTFSEYQKQKDIETGKKWCNDLAKFYSTLEDDGITMKTIMRKEPGEEALDVIVDKSLQKIRRVSASIIVENSQERLQERKI